MDVDEAVANFERATRHCDNLITVHRGHGGPAPGRRDKEVSLNRAVVVLAVASWQAVVQDYTLASVELSAPAPGGPLSLQSYAVLAGRVKTEIGAFATPNAENTRRLMTGAGFDPFPHWTWRQPGGRAQGWITLAPEDVGKRINEWLLVRHAIAHGHAALPKVSVLQAVRDDAVPPTGPELRLVDAEKCLAFFRRLARLTGDGLASHLGASPPSW